MTAGRPRRGSVAFRDMNGLVKQRLLLAELAVGLIVGVGCGLLTPYPGDDDPAGVLGSSGAGVGGSPFDRGDPREPLIDPAEDQTIQVLSNQQVIVANEGEAFLVDLSFNASKSNVVGGGIQFEDRPEIQWTFLEQLVGQANGDIQFGYVVETGTCARIGNLCRKVATKQFAVGSNSDNADVDGDGEADGDFVVSPPAEVDVILRCASCESPSCRELLADTPGACEYCGQPELCNEVFNLCFAPGSPLEATDEADSFDDLLGPNGLAWKNASSCSDGEALCQQAFDRFQDECTAPSTDTEADATGAT
jgi:hypothetical protein